MESTLLLNCLYLLLTVLYGTFGLEDPCAVDSYEMFPGNSFGSRNEICEPRVTPVCDYYLEGNWYVVDNATLLNRCPLTGNCGVAYPTWMDGDFPRVEDGVVNRTVCIKMEGDCCRLNATIQIRNCTLFFVYHLTPLPACPMAYCFESNLPCDPPTTTTQGIHYTSSQVQDTQNDGHKTSEFNENTNALVTGIIVSGLVCLVLGCVIFLVVRMWITGRLRFKPPLSTLAKNQTTVFPHVTKATNRDQLPPPYSEK